MLYKYHCANCGKGSKEEREFCDEYCKARYESGETKTEGMFYENHFNYKDANGEKIWFPKDGKPYWDRALKKTFHSAKEKQEYMKEKRLCMVGDEKYPSKPPIEAGDMRSREFRRANRWED